MASKIDIDTLKKIQEMKATELWQAVTDNDSRREKRPTGQESEPVDQLWQEFLEQKFIPVTLPELVFADPPRKKKRQKYLAVAALFLGILGLSSFWLLQQLAPKQEWQAMLSKKNLVAGSQEFSQGSSLLIYSGSMEVAQKEDNLVVFTAHTVKASFNLKKKVYWQIEHPLLIIKISGTAFELDLKEDFGKIQLTEGRLQIQHRPGTDKLYELEQGEEVFFNKETLTIKKSQETTEKVTEKKEPDARSPEDVKRNFDQQDEKKEDASQKLRNPSAEYNCMQGLAGKVCGYHCVKSLGKVQCAPSPDQMCMAEGGETGCGYHCVKNLGKVYCASARDMQCLKAFGQVRCGYNCRKSAGSIICD